MNNLPLHTKFVRDLVAAFPAFPISVDTAKLYEKEMCGYKLSEIQWEQVLQKCIENRMSDHLPYLTEVRACIDSVKRARMDNNHGMMVFTLGNYEYACRVKCVNGEWVNAIGKHIGEKPKLPEGSTDMRVYPDNPAPPEYWDQMSEDDIRILVEDTLSHIGENNGK